MSRDGGGEVTDTSSADLCRIVKGVTPLHYCRHGVEERVPHRFVIIRKNNCIIVSIKKASSSSTASPTLSGLEIFSVRGLTISGDGRRSTREAPTPSPKIISVWGAKNEPKTSPMYLLLDHDNLSLSVMLMKEVPCFQSLQSRRFEARRGLAEATPRRASKRLDCRLWKHATSFINRTERERLSWPRQAGTRG